MKTLTKIEVLEDAKKLYKKGTYNQD